MWHSVASSTNEQIMATPLHLRSELETPSSYRRPGPSSAAALGIPHEVRLKLAKRMRSEQLRLYYEREGQQHQQGQQGDKSEAVSGYHFQPATCPDSGPGDGQSKEETKRSPRIITFQAKELLLDAVRRSDRDEVHRILSENLAGSNTASEATGSSLLHLCSLNNDLPSMEVLLEHGADVNIQDYDLWTPLHVAAACGHTGIAETLLECDADCTLLDVDGNFAYDSADSADLKELLLKHMSFKGIYEQDLRSLRSRQAKAMLAAVKDCVSRNRNLNFLNRNGVALLHIAAANGYYRIAKLLLDGGADVDVLDDLGYTPLHVAAKFDQVKLVKLLLKRCANPIAESAQLELPVDLSDSDEIVKLLTQAGGERQASKLPEVYSPAGGTFLLPAPLSPVAVSILPDSPSPSNDSGVDTNDAPLTPTQIQSVNINFDEFELARTASKILYRTIPLSKLEVFFEAETLAERDKFDEGTDMSSQTPALLRLHRRIIQRQQSKKLELPDPGATDNLANLSDLTEDIVVHYLKERYQRDQIYTLIGEILIAVNPFKSLPFYSNRASDQYSDSSINSILPPHIFAVADQVYRDMLADKRRQSCVISGESGAGKTETSKLFTQHLLYVAQSEETELSIKIEQVSPVLEAFGNAKTVMNNNSSRFGKYLELVFSYEGAILGGCFKEYLLEKSRVVVQGHNERNFHIFYQMFAGLSDEEKEELNLSDPATHRCLVGSGEPLHEVITPDLGKSFEEVCDSLQAIGFSQQDQESLLNCLASVLHICDLQFASDEEGSVISNPNKVEVVSKLLEVESSELSACLVQEATSTRGEEIVRRRSVVLANDCRDALAKALYRRMFGWIVNGINHHLQPEDVEPTHPLRIGILDIFGFENFEKNSFEQMCINIANEQLQHFFNEYIFKWEQEECAREGIAIETISFQSNWPIVNLFLEKSTGLLSLIDEESRFPRATDRTLAAKMHQLHSKSNTEASRENDVKIYRAPPDRGTKFGVQHYAGYVEYDVVGFLDKNRDTLPPSVQMLMKTSGSLLVREIFGGKLTRTGTVAPSMRQKMSRVAVSPFSHFNKKTSKRLSKASMARRNAQRSPAHGRKFDTGRRAPPTISNHFRNSLSELMEKMNSSKPRFIRCIKPNTDKLPDSFISNYVQKQLQYTGVMETARIRQCGFPTRLTFDDFCKRYWILRELYVPQLVYNEHYTVERIAHRILERVGLKGWACGKTKLMLKFNHTVELDKHTNDIYVKIVTIQRCFRDWQARRMMQELVKVKQKQAKFVKHLIETATYHGLTYFRQLERLNHEDAVRNMQRSGHRHHRETSSVGDNGHHPASQESQGYTMYARVTKPNNINNNANTLNDDTEPSAYHLTAAKVPVYRIRSLPPGGTDDTIMIRNPNEISSPVGKRTNSLSMQRREHLTERTTSPISHSRRHAPLPPLPSQCDDNSVYSLAQEVLPPTQPPAGGAQSSTKYSRQNAPLPPPPTTTSPTATSPVQMTNSNAGSRSAMAVVHGAVGRHHQQRSDGWNHGAKEDAVSKVTLPKGKQCSSSDQQHGLVMNVSSSRSPPETRKNLPLPPLPPTVNSTESEKQTLHIGHVGDDTGSNVNNTNSKQQLIACQPTRESHECNSTRLGPRSPHRSKSPSPSAIPCESQGTRFGNTPNQSQEINSKRPERGYTSSHTSSGMRGNASIHNVDDSNDEVPPAPPPRKTSAPTGSPSPPSLKKSSESTSNLPPVPQRKTSGGNSIVNPEAPPLPSRKISETRGSGVVHMPVHGALDQNEPVAPPLPSRKVVQEPSPLQGIRPERRNAVRTQSSELLTSLPEHEQSTFMGEGNLSRSAMQRKLMGPPLSRNRASSNEFNAPYTKQKLGKRLSDPSSRVAYNRNHIPIHKMPLPPTPLQMHMSMSSPQLKDLQQDVYEDLDKTRASINKDVPQLDYEDIDAELDKSQDFYEDIDLDDDDKPQDHYEDIDMDSDKQQDHYEDIDYDAEDRPQEVYEDINNEAAQRVSFARPTGPQGYTPPISRRSMVIKDSEEPEDYSPPITRKSTAYADGNEPLDYTPPIRRSRGQAYPGEVKNEPQNYTPPIRRSRVFVEEDEPQDYSAPIQRSRVYPDEDERISSSVANEQQRDPPMHCPPLPPRSSSQQQRKKYRSANVPPPPVSTRSSNEQQQQPVSRQSKPVSTTPHNQPVPVRRSRPAVPKSPVASVANKNRVDPKTEVPTQSTSGGVPNPPQAPPVGGPPPPPPPPPPAIGFKATVPASHSNSVQPASNGTDSSHTKPDSIEPSGGSSLLDGIANVQLKKASERKLPQKPLPTSSSGSAGISTANLFAEMQSLQLRKTKHPVREPSPSSANESGSPAASVPFHAALRRSQNIAQPPTQPAALRPAVRPKPSKLQPPSIKPKPPHLLSPKHNVPSPTSPLHSNHLGVR